MLPGCLLPVHRTAVTDMTLRSDTLPRRWTLHGLNSGVIFTMTWYGVRWLPRRVSYAIGWVGAWIAWKLMTRTNDAIASNLEPVFDTETSVQRNRRALLTYRSYTRDAIDFLRSIGSTDAEAQAMFDLRQEDGTLFDTLLAQGRGIIAVTGHWGNWEAGGILTSQRLQIPTTIIAMAEASDVVNR